MRLGIIGKADGALSELRQAIELFFRDPELKQIVYLGDDDAITEVAALFAGEQLDEEAFLQRGVELACQGSSDAIERLLQADREAQRLSLLRRLPAPPACAIEMLERWIILAVHDKAVLEEDDVANAHVIVYGEAPEAAFKRFGPRSFLTPGPLNKGRVGSIHLRPDGGIDIALLDLQGATVLNELVTPALGKVVVTS
ncbi:MAG: hypothetical protein RL701_5210 [Pseudomonadota bacterium]|jgi:hypothetical protein